MCHCYVSQLGHATHNGPPSCHLADTCRVEGEARLAFVRDGKKCNMKFLGADEKRPLASVSSIVDEGNMNRTSRTREQWPKDSDDQDARHVCGAAGLTSGNEIDEDCAI